MDGGSSLLSRVRKALSAVRTFFTVGVWERDYSKHRGLSWFFVRQLQVFVLVAKGMVEDRVQLRAAFLSLVTLLSIVPLLAVVFSVFQASGGLAGLRHQLQQFIYDNMAVGSREDVVQWVDRLVTHVNGGALGGIGSAVLVVASVRLVAAMEATFNFIWGVRRARSMLTRFVIYWCLLTLGPLALGASLAGTASLKGWLHGGVGPGSAILVTGVPILLTIAAFTLLYMVIPSTEVKLKHALVGGIVAGLLFEVAKQGYAWLATNLFRYNLIYGSLGAIPVFILWVYIGWMLVLFGCELTFANQNVSTLRHEERALSASERFRELLATRLVLAVALDFHRGAGPPTAAELSQRTEVSVRLVHEVVRALVSSGLLREASLESSKDPGLLPGRMLSRITVGDVIGALREVRGIDLDMTHDEEHAVLVELLGDAEAAASKVYGRVDYQGLAERFGEGGAEAPATET